MRDSNYFVVGGVDWTVILVAGITDLIPYVSSFLVTLETQNPPPCDMCWWDVEPNFVHTLTIFS